MSTAVADRLQPDAEALIAEARRRTRLEDFGPLSFEAPLRIAVKSMVEEANLTEAGMQEALEECVGHLSTTLRTQAFFAKHPEIDEQEITEPVVIVGLQRTGTSKLFRNIAADPQWNVLYTWLALNPIPPEGWRPGLPDPRLAEAEAWCEERRWMAKAHGFYPKEPEMEALLMLHTFMLNAPMRLMPTHQFWLEQADFRPAYEYLKRQLKFLQWQTGAPKGRRWILKSPPHMLTLDALVDVFPDAKLVMTHRHPKSSVGSMFKLVEISQERSARSVDRHLIRDLWLRNLSTAIGRFMAFREKHGDAAFVNVSFRDFVGDPLPAVKQIYAYAGMPYTPEAEAAAAAWHRDNPRFSEGSFDYDLADYGCSEADIERAFAPYLSRFAAHL